ncbi:TPA_asm: P [Cardamine alphacytorhabdovirus 1]|nr:TPA_asm: P [Cardamine alphacytorhabdovirus 1]
MDHNNYDDVSDPILDLPMSGVAGDDDEGNYVDDSSPLEDVQDDQADIPLVDQNLQQDYASENDADDHDYDHVDLDVVLQELRDICSDQGVPCTGPMEQMVKIKHTKETIFYSGLVWFVRGIALANQTQVIPTVMSAMNDMKMETKLLQQSSYKMNKEVEKASRLTGDIVEELNSIKEKMQDSFRDSIQKFIETHSRVEHAKTDASGPCIGDSMNLVKGKEKVEGVIGSVVERASPTEIKKEDTESKAQKVLGSKKQMLLRVGFKPNWIKDVGDEIIDIVYDDEMHNSVSAMKLTTKVKEYIVTTVKERLTDLLEGN